MKPQRLLVFLAIVFAGIAPPLHAAQAAVPPEKEKAIRQLLEVTGASRLSQQMMDQMLASFQQNDPSIPQEFWTGFRKKMKVEELIDLLIPIYDRHFTREDIDGLLAFYHSPLGKKLIATLPQVSQESMAVGQEWGKRKAQEVMRELEKRNNKK